MDTQSVNSPLEEAVRRFTAKLSEEEKQDFQFSTLEDVNSTVASLQSRLHTEKRYRNVARLELFLASMAQYVKVMEVFSPNAAEVASLIWVKCL
jgi:hypothetical protein